MKNDRRGISRIWGQVKNNERRLETLTPFLNNAMHWGDMMPRMFETAKTGRAAGACIELTRALNIDTIIKCIARTNDVMYT